MWGEEVTVGGGQTSQASGLFQEEEEVVEKTSFHPFAQSERQDQIKQVLPGQYAYVFKHSRKIFSHNPKNNGQCLT